MHLISENTMHMLNNSLSSLQQSVDMAIHIALDSQEGLDPEFLRLEEKTPAQLAELDTALTEHCALVENAFSAIANNTAGIVTYYYCIDSGLGSSEHGFFLSKLNGDEFERQPPLLSDELDPEDNEHTTWYYSPIAAGKPIWIGPYRAHFLGDLWTVSYVSPIYAGDVLLGVLGMDILLDTMTSRISTWKFYDTGFVSLLDADGRVLYHPKLEIGDTPTLISENLREDSFRANSSAGEQIRYTVDGEERQLAFATLTNGMKAVVVAPVREITATRRQLTVYLLIAAALLLAVSAVITVLFAGSITKPLRTLTLASRELANGDFDVKLDHEGKDEVGVLTESFRQMRDHVKLYISDLNSRAFTDALTRVKNKGAFDIYAARLNDTIRQGGAAQPSFAIVMFDCNRLKQINDVHGHECGDIYLQTACRAICETFSHSPVFRLGGDEFAVLLQNQDYAERIRLLREFDARVEKINAGASQPWETVSLSRGMSEFCPGQDTDVGMVLRRADQTMYEDKRYFMQQQARQTQ